MADVQDLFVERIEGDRYLFEDEWRPLRGRPRGDRRQGPRRAGGARGAHRPTTARSSTRRSAPTTAEPLALRWLTLRRTDRLRAGMFELLDIDSGPELVAQPRGPHLARLEPDLGRPPRLDRLQADRPPAAAPRRLPRPAEAGLERRVRVGGDGPLRGAAGGRRPRERLPDHRQQPDRRRRVPAPHHQRVARRLPRQADRGAARGDARSTTSRASRRCRPTTSRCPGSRRRARLGRLQPARPARAQRDRAAAQLGRPARPRHDRRHDLPGLPAAAGARGGARGDRRPRPLRALARPRRQRLHRRTSPRPGAGTRT